MFKINLNISHFIKFAEIFRIYFSTKNSKNPSTRFIRFIPYIVPSTILPPMIYYCWDHIDNFEAFFDGFHVVVGSFGALMQAMTFSTNNRRLDEMQAFFDSRAKSGE